jgi:hypothetical protein
MRCATPQAIQARRDPLLPKAIHGANEGRVIAFAAPGFGVLLTKMNFCYSGKKHVRVFADPLE